MAKEFEGLEKVIQDISGDVERMSSDEALIKSLEKYIKEDPLAYLGWQMYKMNLIDMKMSKQKPGENLIRFDDGQRVEVGGVYGRKGLKSIPVRTGFEKSENVVVFDEDAPILGSVVVARGAREENPELLAVLHELRHSASIYLQNKYPKKYFSDETNSKIEEGQQRVQDLHTLISTGDYKDGQLSDRAALAFADEKQLFEAQYLAQKSARLALEELDLMNVPVTKKMRDSAKKIRHVYNFELGEKDRAHIKLIKESLERVRLKKENGDVDMMELERSVLDENVLNTALDHIHAYESQRGTLNKTDESGGTRSEYHMKVEVAAEYDDRFNGMTQDQYNAIITPPEEKALVSKHLEVLRQEATDAGVNFNSLNAGEQVSLLSTLFNRRTQPNTLQSFSQLTFARDNNRPDQEDFRIAARNSLDVTKDAGERSLGVMHRTVSHQQTFDGNVNVDETFNAKPAEQFPDGYMGDLYADIHSKSKASESFREKAIRVRERSAYFMQPLQDKKSDVQIIPGRQGEPFMGVPVPPPRPDRSPEEISGFPAEATFP